MPGFSIGGAVNGASGWLCTAPIVRSVICNPVATALLITALAAVVVMAVYYRHWLKGSGVKRGARALVYVFLAVSAVTFVHHYAVMAQAQEAAAQKGVRERFTGIQQSRLGGQADTVPVLPAGYGGAASAPPPQGPLASAGPASVSSLVLGAAEPAAPRPGARPDNLAGGASAILLEDVVVPGVYGW